MTSKVTNFIKQYAFMLALAAMFIGFSAFRISEEVQVVPEQNLDGDWFEYDETKNFSNGELNPKNYNYLGSGTPPNDCAPGHQVCAINAPNDGGLPEIDETLEADIQEAMGEGESIPNRVLVRL